MLRIQQKVACVVFSLQLFALLTVADSTEDPFGVLHYLAQFGYVNKEAVSSNNLVDITSGLAEFQKMMGLNVTGTLDSETMKVMSMARCGNADKPEAESTPTRTKRYKLNNGRWPKRDVSYRISSFSRLSRLDPAAIQRDVEKAFELWEQETDLNFIPFRQFQNGEVDIDLKFATYSHGDNSPFDGPGRVLGHAFQPGSGHGGDVHFDDSEMWTVDTKEGSNVFMVAVHEIGHALGLSHSNEYEAIMFPIYTPYNPNLKLSRDDIRGIQSIYGPKPQKRVQNPYYTTVTTTPRIFASVPAQRPDNKQPQGTGDLRPRVESGHRTAQRPDNRQSQETGHIGPRIGIGHTNRMHNHGNMAPPTTLRPKGFSRVDLCNDPHIDAITMTMSRTIYLFKGVYVYQIEMGSGVKNGWPKRSDYAFRGLPGKIDAAMTRRNGATYFFVKDKYWRFHETKQDANYPKKINKNFPGIPTNLDAAFEWPVDNQLYFFKGNKYWAFNPESKKTYYIDKKYPLPISTIGLQVDSIDAALVAPNGKTYLFKDSQYWRLDDFQFKVANVVPPYPRSTKEMWLKCTTYQPSSQQI